MGFGSGLLVMVGRVEASMHVVVIMMMMKIVRRLLPMIGKGEVSAVEDGIWSITIVVIVILLLTPACQAPLTMTTTVTSHEAEAPVVSSKKS
jgi:hypothetical protein